MKCIKFLLVVLFFFSSCSSEKRGMIELNDEDTYELINEYFVNDIKKENEKVIFAIRQLKKPKITWKEIDSVKKDVYFPERIKEFEFNDGVEIEFPFDDLEWNSKTSKRKWNKEKFPKVSFLEKNHFLKANDSVSLRSVLEEEFGNSRVHYVSYPIFYPQENIALIVDEPIDIGYSNCILQRNFYFYVKEKEGWRSLKEFGKVGYYWTLHKYFAKIKEQEESR